jgi:hypothetical protein
MWRSPACFFDFPNARPVSLLFEVFVVSKFEVLGQIVNQNPCGRNNSTFGGEQQMNGYFIGMPISQNSD